MLSNARAFEWLAVASGSRKLGAVRSRRAADGGQRWYVDFGRRWGPRFLYSFRGVRFETRAMAAGILSWVEFEVSKGRALGDVLSEVAPEATSEAGVREWVERWVALFERKVAAGDRQPRTLADYKRWAGLHAYQREPGYAQREGGADHFAWWYERSIFEIDAASIEEWSYWLAERMAAKSRWNCMAAFHAFLAWLARSRKGFEVPHFEWPEKPDHLPTVVSREVQTRILEAVPEPKRGIYYALADCLIRPSEARALSVRAWDGRDELRVAEACKEAKLGGRIAGRKRRGSEKVLPVSERLRAWLEAHVPRERLLAEPDAPLFVNPHGRNAEGRYSESALKDGWRRAAAAVGVQIGLYEGTKHSTATYLKSQGADDRVLAELMGHADLRSVEKYARVQASAIRAALQRLR